MMALAAYMTRSLQLVFGTTKQAQAQRAEELHRDVFEDIPLREPASPSNRSRATSISQTVSDLPPAQLAEPAQLRVQDHRHNDNTTQVRALDAALATAPPSPVLPHQDPPSPARVERYAAHLSRLADTITFGFVFLFVGTPVYFATPSTLPLHLAISVLAYQAATRLVPASYLRFLHPVLVSSLVTVLVIWAFATMNRVSLRSALLSYRTGTNYRALLRLREEGADLSRLGPEARRCAGLLAAPEDRLGHAAVPDFSLTDNTLLTAGARKGLVRKGLIDRAAARAFAQDVIRAFDVRTPGPGTAAKALSGGNLQKFVIGREVMQAPRVLVVNQPTWGVDAGAAAAVRQSLLDLAGKGAGVIVISQDLDEILELSDRFCALNEGRLSAPVPTDGLTLDQIGLMLGGAHGMEVAHL